jgi:hypothetical protein
MGNVKGPKTVIFLRFTPHNLPKGSWMLFSRLICVKIWLGNYKEVFLSKLISIVFTMHMRVLVNMKIITKKTTCLSCHPKEERLSCKPFDGYMPPQAIVAMSI